MADTHKLGFGPITSPAGGVLVVFADDSLTFGPKTRALLGEAADLVARAAKSERFTGKSGSALDIVAPAGLKASRLIVLGTGKAADKTQDKAQAKPQDFVKLGGAAMGRIPAAASEATMVLELAEGPLQPDSAADVALGATLRGY
jgi:leucyl aminopeptidase